MALPVQTDQSKGVYVMIHLLLAVIYLSFISLGLPDGLLGSGWPVMYQEFTVPVSYMGIVSMIIAGGTIVSSLNTDRLIRKLGTGKVTLLSVFMTAAALFGFSCCHSFWAVCLWAIPYGLGAGCVDAGLNNYVALHYSSRDMSWLHCMWGIGASTGPYIMGYVLTSGQRWNTGYFSVGVLQIVLTAVLLLSLPLWKAVEGGKAGAESSDRGQPLKLREVIRIPGAKSVLIMFCCYCALEQTAGQWASSYLALGKGMDAETAATWGSLFYLGITVGRGINGFIAMKLSDSQMIRMGCGIIASGITISLLPLGTTAALVGLILIGLGCAPIYPCVVHSTPDHFGADRSQAIIGVQMAFAYIGTCFAPPVFGLIARYCSITAMPLYLLAFLITMTVLHELLCRVTHSAG